jgi:hypothetical protein
MVGNRFWCGRRHVFVLVVTNVAARGIYIPVLANATFPASTRVCAWSEGCTVLAGAIQLDIPANGNFLLGRLDARSQATIKHHMMDGTSVRLGAFLRARRA